MTNPAILQFRDVHRAFVRGQPVLAGVTFGVHEAEVVSLVGRNGTGKTTLMQIAMGMLFPQAGSVRVFGLSPTDHPVDVKRRIGYVAGGQALPGQFRIDEMLAFHRTLFPTWDPSLEKELLKRFGLVGNTTKIGKLSMGQARQVALLCAVCHRPELLLLDEPAAGLDAAARREFLETSIQLLNREGTSILVSSHHLNDVERLGGRVVLLDNGTIRLDEELDDLREGYCVAIMPEYSTTEAALCQLPGFMRTRVVYGDWRAVFRGAPAEVEALLASSLGITDARCASVPLEEFFVELVGGARAESPA
ncbi:MAG: ABC transporter ATP-binding protein [bacterium]